MYLLKYSKRSTYKCPWSGKGAHISVRLWNRRQGKEKKIPKLLEINPSHPRLTNKLNEARHNFLKPRGISSSHIQNKMHLHIVSNSSTTDSGSFHWKMALEKQVYTGHVSCQDQWSWSLLWGISQSQAEWHGFTMINTGFPEYLPNVNSLIKSSSPEAQQFHQSIFELGTWPGLMLYSPYEAHYMLMLKINFENIWAPLLLKKKCRTFFSSSPHKWAQGDLKCKG